MKYESSILKRLIDTYGVIGNPRYLSEIIKEFIVRGKELYPQLFTYQSDWLAHIDEFGLTPEYTVSYTGQHIYAPNTKEKPVKSAILKGQTLVNLAIDNSAEFTTNDNWKHTQIKGKMLSTTKNYLVKFNSSQDYSGYVHLRDFSTNTYITDSIRKNFKKGSNVVLLSEFLRNDLESFSNIKITFYIDNNATVPLTITNIMLIEYQDGMENWDIPYFEGMQSVRMPVLTTSNEDGTKTNILTVNEDVTLRSNGDVYDELNLLTGRLTQRIDENNEVLAQAVVKTVDLTIHDKDHQKVERLTTFEGGTHFTTSTQDGSLLPTLTVDVVTDLEKSLMVCSLEGNTM